MLAYCKRVLVSIDQLVNTLFNGDEDETICSRVGKRIREGKATSLEVWVGSFFTQHIADSIEEDEGNDVG